MLVEVKLHPGDTLIKEGEASDCIYIVKSGELRVYKFKDSKSVELGYIQAGEIVGEMSFLDNAPRSATVKANLETVVTMMNRTHFNELISSANPILKILISNLSSRLRKANSKLMI